MSYDGIKDADLDLKIKLMNYLWYQGYITRPCIKIYHYQEGSRTSKTFTDIDVLGIKFDYLKEPIKIVCSAKTGNVSDSQQIFLLSGIKSYVDAQNAIYIRNKASISGVSELSKKLNVVSINENELMRMSNNIGVDLNNIRYLNTKDCYIKNYDLFRILKDELKHVYNYITEKYWIDMPNNSVLRSITCMKEINNSKMNQSIKLYFKYYCISLFLASMIQIINKLSAIPNELFIIALETELLGGEYSESEKKNIVEKISKLMDQYTKFLSTKITIPLDKIVDFSNLLEIPHFEDLSDLSIRLRENKGILRYIPQMLDIIIFEVVQKQTNTINYESLKTMNIMTKEQKILSGKMIKDILIFLERVGIFKREEIQMYIDNL